MASLAILTSILVISTYASPIIPSNTIDVPTLLSAVGLPPCANACLGDIFIAAREMLSFTDPNTQFEQLCRSYDDASLCIAATENGCFDQNSREFFIGFSGVEAICRGKQEELERHSKCLRDKYVDHLRECDDSCGFSSALASLSQNPQIQQIAKEGGAYQQVLMEMGPLCSSMGCASSCIAHKLNMDCAPSGTFIVEALLTPFFRASALLDQMGPEVKIMAFNQLPSQCYYLIEKGQLTNITFGLQPSESLPIDPVEALVQEESIVQQNILQTSLENVILQQDFQTVNDMREKEIQDEKRKHHHNDQGDQSGESDGDNGSGSGSVSSTSSSHTIFVRDTAYDSNIGHRIFASPMSSSGHQIIEDSHTDENKLSSETMDSASNVGHRIFVSPRQIPHNVGDVHTSGDMMSSPSTSESLPIQRQVDSIDLADLIGVPSSSDLEENQLLGIKNEHVFIVNGEDLTQELDINGVPKEKLRDALRTILLAELSSLRRHLIAARSQIEEMINEHQQQNNNGEQKDEDHGDRVVVNNGPVEPIEHNSQDMTTMSDVKEGDSVEIKDTSDDAEDIEDVTSLTPESTAAPSMQDIENTESTTIQTMNERAALHEV